MRLLNLGRHRFYQDRQIARGRLEKEIGRLRRERPGANPSEVLLALARRLFSTIRPGGGLSTLLSSDGVWATRRTTFTRHRIQWLNGPGVSAGSLRDYSQGADRGCSAARRHQRGGGGAGEVVPARAPVHVASLVGATAAGRCAGVHLRSARPRPRRPVALLATPGMARKPSRDIKAVPGRSDVTASPGAEGVAIAFTL